MRSAGVVSAAVFLSRISGLVREMIMARLFGAGAAYDAFLLGFRIPNLARDLFAEGALSSAFVPVFSKYLATKGKREAAELSNLVATALALVVGGICVLGIVFSPQLVWLLASGFARVPGKFELGRHADPHHVPVPAAGGAGGAGHGHPECPESVRHPGAFLDVFQHRIGGLRSGLRIHRGPLDGPEPDHVDGLGRGGRRGRAMAVSEPPACIAPASHTARASTSRIPACATSCG
jgi:hypothetical protein